MLIIGTDEAGYGPNLGPLVITATLWKVPDRLASANLYDVLKAAVARPCEDDDERLKIGDSKQLYKSGGGLQALELGVLGVARHLFPSLTTWTDVWNAFSPDCTARMQAAPWFTGYQLDVPCDCCSEKLAAAVQRCQPAFQEASVQLLGIHSRVVFPDEWNTLLDDCGGKAEVLSRATLLLVRDILQRFEGQRALVHCDKHGGRNHYAALLQDVMGDEWVEVRQESRPLSVYRIGPAKQRREFSFAMEGENHLASALASMTSKYLRELAMKAFNAFWCDRVPGLKPTCGYPTDAKRFYRDIAATQEQLGIGETLVWRKR